jgi:TPR repeat protein
MSIYNQNNLVKTIFLVVILGFFQTTYGNAFDDAKVAYKNGDYVTALRGFRSLAGQGNAQAENALGIVYLEARAVKKDYIKAMFWFQ